MKIYIDPGHGGSDPGAVGINGTRECDVVLKTGKALAERLLSYGFETEMTRDTDKSLSLAARAESANRAGADLFISIHCNGFSNSNASGTEVYSYPGNAEGERLAGILLEEICDTFATKKRGVKKENFAVLRLSKMPAVLIETAFITNPEEERMMNSPDFAEKMADAIADGICDYAGVNRKEKASQPHWGKEYLDKLAEKGYINNRELWEQFDASPTNAMVLALFSKIVEGK